MMIHDTYIQHGMLIHQPSSTGAGGAVLSGAGGNGWGERGVIAMGGALHCVLGGVCVCDDGDGDQRGVDPGGLPHVEHPSRSVGATWLPCAPCVSATAHLTQAVPQSEAKLSAYAPTTELEMQLVWPQHEHSPNGSIDP